MLSSFLFSLDWATMASDKSYALHSSVQWTNMHRFFWNIWKHLRKRVFTQESFLSVPPGSNDNRFQKPPWPTPDSRWHPGRSWADRSPGQCRSRRCFPESPPPPSPRVRSWGSRCGWISRRKQEGGESDRKSGRRGSSGPFLHSQLWETRDMIGLHRWAVMEKSLFTAQPIAGAAQRWCKWVNWGGLYH